MIKLSIIIPIYNAEKYIKTCLDSILEQRIDEIEIIMINDGSKDNTQAILEEYSNQYPNKIKIVTKQNGGQGSARNIGIDMAKGEYVTFIDIDDIIEKEMLQQMYQKAKQENLDVVVCDYYEIRGQVKVHKKAIQNITEDIKKNYIVCVAGPCNKLIKTELLKKHSLYFLENGIYEDIAMIPLIGVYANKIGYIEKPYYHYYIRTRLNYETNGIQS